jgi:hypothetical protein
MRPLIYDSPQQIAASLGLHRGVSGGEASKLESRIPIRITLTEPATCIKLCVDAETKRFYHYWD